MPGFPRLKASYDLLVLGGGHAGLQAGLKAALLHQTACVIDRGPKYSRSYYAPRMDNIPGMPNGISGHALLDQQVAQVRAVEGTVSYLSPARALSARRIEGGEFEVEIDWLARRHAVRGRALLLAMGIVDRMPVVGGSIEPIFPWANFGIVDFCVLCDGHTLTGKSVAVLGHDRFAVLTVFDLLHFAPASVTVLTHGQPLLGSESEAGKAELLERLDSAGVRDVVEEEIVGFGEIREKRFGVTFRGGLTRSFDKGFSALGWYDMHRSIPESLGASFDPDGYVRIDEDSRVLDRGGSPIPGLYCAGDQAVGWNQIPEAWATAERAVIHAWASYW